MKKPQTILQNLFFVLCLLLAASSQALASLEVTVKKADPNISRAVDTIKWPKRFIDKQWQFGNVEKKKVYGHNLQLIPGGKIRGYSHPNEHHWGIEDGAVVFYHSSGKPSCRFSEITKKDGKVVMSGSFLLNDTKGVSHFLREIDPPPLQDIQVFFGTMQSATGPDGKALFTPLARGKYLLKIDHPGFLPYEEEIAISSRQKQEKTIMLQPATRGSYIGVVSWRPAAAKRIKQDLVPLPGAKIIFTPQKTTLTRNGIRTIVSDFKGDFTLENLPFGTYQVTVTAPGFTPLKKVINHEMTLSTALPFLLKAIVDKQEKLTVRVQDALSKQPIAHAKITLAEAGTTGIIDEKTTDTSGRVRFSNIPIGARNLAYANRLAVARPQVTVLAAAQGYATKHVPLTLPSKELVVALAPQQEIKEQEPNNDTATAQKIIAGTSITTRIATRGDKDFFQFHLDHPARVTIATTEPAALQTFFRLMDANGKEIASHGVHENQHNHLIARGLPAGQYLLQIEEWGNNNSSTSPIHFRVTVENTPDALEPNGKRDQARLIAIGQEVRATIFPKGDADWFRFHVNRPGKIQFSLLAAPWQRSLSLFQDGKKEALTERGVHEDQELRLIRDLVPGDYFLQVTEWGNNNESLVPYTLKLDYLEDDGLDDPAPDNIPMQPVRNLNKNGFAAGSIFPVGDKDIYQIKIPGPGRLHIRGNSPIQLHLSLSDKEGKNLVKSGSHEHQKNSMSYDSNSPQTLNLVVEEWGNNNASTDLYTIETHWQPADAHDMVRRNETMETAQMIKPGKRLRHTIFPLNDKDFYRIAIDHPGFLQVKGRTPTNEQIWLCWLDNKGQQIGKKGYHENQTIDFSTPVPAGPYFLQVEEWGNNNSSVQPYDLEILHRRAEPGEANLDDSDPPRVLQKGIAQSFTIDWNKDVDHFHYPAKAGEKLFLSIKSPLEVYVSIKSDATDTPLLKKGFNANSTANIPITVTQDTTLDVRVIEWGQNNHSPDAALIMVDDKPHDLPLPPVITGIPCGGNPGSSCFTVEAEKEQTLPKNISIDTNLDGRFTLRVDPQKGEEYRFKKPGVYEVAAQMSWGGKDPIVAQSRIWADSQQAGKQTGVELSLDGLENNEKLTQKRPITLFASPSSGARLSRVVCLLDEKPLKTMYTPPFTIELPWLRLGEGQHHLKAIALDSRGKKKSLERIFSLSPYFGLRPADGAKITGENVRILWSGQKFGPATVRYRESGSKKWHTVHGESGRLRSVLLRGLSPGKSYQYQAVVGKEPSEQRTIHLLKGLAFGKSDYGANIKREYDQRVGISVRNNGTRKLQVRLECGKPADPSLLVSFVGEGSEDKPFILEPKEERQFMLAISAQDVNTADHSFPIKIVSEDGLADEAMVNLHVRLPVVKLVWQKLGDVTYGMGQKYRISNRGDSITDLSVGNTKNTFYTIPSINHGNLPSGASVDITVYPRLSEGFTHAEDILVARGMGKEFRQKVAVQIPDGERLFETWLIPGVDPRQDPFTYNKALSNLNKAMDLDPSTVDWSSKEMPEDLDLDGKPDRWTIMDFNNDLIWVGDDSTGDGQIDFVHADQGMDGIFEFSAFRKDKGWQRTNLVEAWLEMGFSLPWAASAYKPHDADILFNDTVIGRLRDTIPNGNYSFRIPPHLVHFNSQGIPEGNRVGINTKHLRGGHYVVNSDYRFTFRLTATPVWSAAKNKEEAFTKALDIEGLGLDTPDYSISSSDTRLTGATPEQLEPGLDLKIECKIRNLGSASLSQVPVALFDTRPGQNREEVARIKLDNIPMNGKKSFEVPWKSRGGRHVLELVVDPEKALGDAEYQNNSASLLVTIPGDDEPPELQLVTPKKNGAISQPVTDIVVMARDIQGLAEVSASIDGGLWQKLLHKKGQYHGKMLLQPGEHLLRVRATDLSGNIAEKQQQLTFSAKKPDVHIIFPHTKAKIKARNTKVMIKIPPTTVGAAARVEGGPWFGARIAGNFAKTFVPLRYGTQNLEVMLIREDGIIGSKKIAITCTRQPQENDNETLDTGKNILIPVQGLGRMPLFGDWNLVVEKKYSTVTE
ncbi:MAG: hypothetical protein CSA26_02385 [Desulfobacterales bacterium]|nr:MAG: hypothetical protein CSA26_02385 [Desulfobacterales bacterium]